MTLRYLEIFLALARTPNMRDAAAKLFISQAAVSSALRGLKDPATPLTLLLENRIRHLLCQCFFLFFTMALSIESFLYGIQP